MSQVVEFEIIGTNNPVVINLSNFVNVLSIEVEQFVYIPSTASLQGPQLSTQASVTAPNFLGIMVTGTKGRYSELGFAQDCILSVPLINGIYNYQLSEQGQGEHEVWGGGSDVTISFVSRDGGSTVPSQNQPPVAFTGRYMLTLNLVVNQ